MARIQMNLNVEESVRDELQRLCAKIETVDGRPISLATAVSKWVESSVKTGYLLGVADLTTTAPKDDLAEMKEAIATLTQEVAEIKK